MPLATLSGVRYDSIELSSRMNDSAVEAEHGPAEFVAKTGLRFAPSRDQRYSVIYGTAKISLKATEDQGRELFSLEAQFTLRFEFPRDSEISREEVVGYLRDEENLKFLTMQAQPLLNEKVMNLVNEGGMEMPFTLHTIRFKGRFFDLPTEPSVD